VAGWLRRAGHLALDDGRAVTWSVAEGRRGRRWREAVRKPDQPGIRHSLLLELDPDGWFSHLELSTGAGLLTLHPEGDGTLHGNVIRATGVEHLRGLSWNPHAIVLIDGSVISRLAAFPGLATVLEPGSVRSAVVLRVPADLHLRTATEQVGRSEDGRKWSIEGEETLRVDDDGLLPTSPPAEWPLED
jgi:hypothetical protein